MAKVIGIDLGTTLSVVAVVEGGEPNVIENAEGARLTPSVVAVNPKTGERYVGLLARRQAITNPENTVFSVKRLMGRKYDDREVQEAMKRLPYKVVKAANGDAHVVMGDRAYSPPEVSAMVLQKLKADAEARLGEKITQAVITVPAYFNDAQRQATKDAGKIAGLEVLRIINEPTASALAFGLDKKKKKDMTVAVFDLGGGTFDVSVLTIGEGVFEVKSTSGDTYLGGDDFDQKIMDWLVDEFRRESGIDLRKDRMALQRLKEAGEKAKIEKSSQAQTEINLPIITADARGPKHLVKDLSRAKLEQLCADLIERLEQPCRRALEDAKLQPHQIDEAILVGGMSRMPAVQRKAAEIFGKEPSKSVNPDEAVAQGAAIQAAVLKGDVKDILLLDVTPLTLGVETLGGVVTALIPRNSTVPTSKSETFTTAADGQPSVEIHIVQGERPLARETKSLARFILDGILPAPRGVPKVEVTFDIDANGILNVRARDTGTGREQKVIVQPSSGLSKDQIENMVKEAETHADADKRQREEVEAINQADSLAYSAEKLLREQGDKVPAHLKADLEKQVSEVKQAVQAKDAAKARQASATLSATLQQVGQAVYSQAQGQAGAGPAGSGGPEKPPKGGPAGPGESGSGAVEGEFREV
ncbi:MAG: molecular chaperone DnaK [Dehalococcoidia bacterium]|nr:molecular chaperone DnaK [Dehalococcoidia bacterium]